MNLFLLGSILVGTVTASAYNAYYPNQYYPQTSTYAQTSAYPQANAYPPQASNYDAHNYYSQAGHTGYPSTQAPAQQPTHAYSYPPAQQPYTPQVVQTPQVYAPSQNQGYAASQTQSQDAQVTANPPAQQKSSFLSRMYNGIKKDPVFSALGHDLHDSFRQAAADTIRAKVLNTGPQYANQPQRYPGYY